MARIAVFPGSFDPLTRGHESIVRRAVPLFDEIFIAIGENAEKKGFFPVEKRIEWIERVFGDLPTVTVSTYSGLTVEYCRKIGAEFIVRGLRTSADFEFERSIGQINKQLEPSVETVFFLTTPEFSALTSSIVRDIIRHGGDPLPFIPIGLKLI